MLALSAQIITEDGETLTIRFIHSITYTKVCPYLDHEFQTINANQLFCCDSHRVMFCKKNRD